MATSDEYSNLIEEVPRGFEITELPEDAKVVIRKVKPVATNYEEKEIVQDAIEEFSDIKDFFIHAEHTYLYHSQFNYTGGQDANLTREEAIDIYGYKCLKFGLFQKRMILENPSPRFATN